MAAFRKKLNELGYSEGQYEIDARYADGHMNRLGELTTSLIATKPDAILAVAPQPAFTIARATPSIPLVFVGVGDPVTTGLVSSLAKPGATVTGLSMVAVELTGKRLELLKEVVPDVAHIGIIVDPGSSVSMLELNEARSTATKLPPRSGNDRSNIPRIKACRYPRRATQKLRTSRQPQDRKDDRHEHSRDVSVAGR